MGVITYAINKFVYVRVHHRFHANVIVHGKSQVFTTNAGMIELSDASFTPPLFRKNSSHFEMIISIHSHTCFGYKIGSPMVALPASTDFLQPSLGDFRSRGLKSRWKWAIPLRLTLASDS